MTDSPNALAERLSAASEFLATYSDLPAPYVTGIEYTSGDSCVELRWFVQIKTSDHAEQKAAAVTIIRAVGGKWDKVPGDTFAFRSTWNGLRLSVTVEREAVCERVVTGKETVTIPAKAAEPERTIEQEVVEWRCEPLLAEAAR